MTARAFAAGLIAALLLLLVRPALAQSSARSRVVIAAHSDASERALDVSRRIAAELRLAGFEVSVVTDDAAGDAVAAAAPGAGTPGGSAAFAWIVLSSAGPIEADVWIRHPRSGVPSARRVDARDVEAASSQGALAIRAVEALRGTMFNLSRDPDLVRALPPDVLAWAEASPEAAIMIASPPPPPPASAPAAPAPAPTRAAPDLYSAPTQAELALAAAARPDAEPPIRTWIGTGFATLGAFGSLGLSFGPRVSVSQELPYSFSVGVSALGTFPAHNVTANAYQFLALGEGVYTFGRKSWPVQPHVDLGVGVHAYDASDLIAASASAPGSRQVGVAFALASGFGADFPVGSFVRIGLEVAAIFVVPEPLLGTGGGFTDGARQPMITSSLSVELAP